MITSVETTLSGARLTGSGTLKNTRVPVIVLVGAKRENHTVFCSLASFHAGLVPGEYEMSDGTTITVPKGLVGSKHAHHPNVTLEVRT